MHALVNAFFALLLAIFDSSAHAETVRVAVASNFVVTMRALAERFEAETGNTVRLSPGSTGTQYAQIHQGAPFDLFFAADTIRPRLLEEHGVAVAGSRFTYAIGGLALWSPQPGLVDSRGDVLRGTAFRHLAIANPKLAPYGMAARQVLEALGLWAELQPRLVFGENIGQAFQLVASGNAELGFVARAQVVALGDASNDTGWQPPLGLYSPLEQQVVLLSEDPTARALLQFVRSDAGRALIRDHGYETP